MLGLMILCSLLLGSSLSFILTPIFVERLSINLYSSGVKLNIPSFSESLATQKTFDMVNFVLFVVVAALIFIFNYLFVLRRNITNIYLATIYFIFSALIYLQTHFVFSSKKETLFLTALLQILFVVLNVKKVDYRKINLVAAANGFFAGFFLLILLKKLTGSTAIPLGVFLSMPFLYLLTDSTFSKITRHPAHIILILAAFFPFNSTATFFVFLGFLVLLKAMRARWLIAYYPYFVLFIFAYNPLFYLGTFDAVEEGFWLGWLERILNGQTIYKDFFAYHPPLILWGMTNFIKFTEATIYNFRLYLHALQLVGLAIIFAVASKVVDKKILKVFLMLLILSVLTINVKNNGEIRLGIGLLASLPIYYFIRSKNYKLIILSGIASVIALLTSIEIGVVTIISSAFSLSLLAILLKKNVVKTLLHYILGLLIILIPVGLYMYFNGSLLPFFDQIHYFTRIFSSGFRNVPISHPEQSTMLQWYVVDKFFTSDSLYWELVKMSILAGGFYVFLKFLKKDYTNKDLYAGVLCIFSLLLFRPILGRSDYYHLLTLLVPSLIILTYLLEKLTKSIKYLDVFILIAISLFTFRTQVHQNFLQAKVTLFQTYGNMAGQYPRYLSGRSGIYAWTGVDTQTEDSLVSFIKDNTTKNDSIFVFPQRADLYFLTDRNNATRYDTPYIFFTPLHQEKMINELQVNKPKYVLYKPSDQDSELNVGSVGIVNTYLLENYIDTETFGPWWVMTAKK